MSEEIMSDAAFDNARDRARGDAAQWNPRPHPDCTNFSKRAYLAGYSDGFHGYHFGAGDQGAFGAFSDYKPGFSDGRQDRAGQAAQ